MTLPNARFLPTQPEMNGVQAAADVFARHAEKQCPRRQPTLENPVPSWRVDDR